MALRPQDKYGDDAQKLLGRRVDGSDKHMQIPRKVIGMSILRFYFQSVYRRLRD
jgi:hypothetical protein